MSGWSSFKEEQDHFNSWRSFLNEEFYAAGIESAEMEDSLLNWLKPLVGKEIDDEQLAQILKNLKASAEEEDILLEALGGPAGPNKKFSFKATSALSDVIDSFPLQPAQRKKLEKTINRWANTNQIQFTTTPSTAAPKEEPTSAEPTSGEEEGIVAKAAGAVGDVAEKAREFATSDAGQALENALDIASFVPAANVPASIFATALNIGQGEYRQAALSLAGVIPFAGLAGKAGKFGPLILQVGEMAVKAKKVQGAKSARELMATALKSVGSDATVDDTLEATKRFIGLYEKASGLPGFENLAALGDQYIAPLEHLIKNIETPAPLSYAAAVATLSDEEMDRAIKRGMFTVGDKHYVVRSDLAAAEHSVGERVQRIHEEKLLKLTKAFTH